MSHSTGRMMTRVKSIYLFIKQEGSVSTRELVEEFGTTERTIQRDLKILEYNHLVTSPNRGKWQATNRKVVMN